MVKHYSRSDGVLIPLIDEPFCEDCSNPITPDFTKCYWCYKEQFLVDIIQIRTVEYYFEKSERPSHVLSNEIRSLKFDNKPEYAVKLGECLTYQINNEYPDLKKINCIVSAPKASKNRPYDQAILLAQDVSKRTGIPYYDALTINGEIQPSYSMSMQERIQQLDGKIRSSYNFNGNSVLIIDDICTTGATLRECAKIIRNANAPDVKGLVVGKKVDNLLLLKAGRRYEE